MTLLAVIFSLGFAKWCQREVHLFCERVNQQIYQEYQTIRGEVEAFSQFQQHSILKTKETPLAYTFYIIFPFLILYEESLWLSLIFMLLYFLAVLDYYYHLTDSRYIGAIFIFGLIYQLQTPQIETLIFTTLFFIGVIVFSNFLLKKEALGMGDVFLFIALAPLFSVEEMLKLILLSALLGIGFWGIYFCKTRKKLDRLPFIPFIGSATFCHFYG